MPFSTWLNYELKISAAEITDTVELDSAVTHKSCDIIFFYPLAPIAPVVGNVTYVTVSELVAGIYLWRVEQRNGPIR